ncbi:MAG: phosphonate metabolism protein/1,5-bisphosphokinase (PRPP-forming) PhnN [Marinobacter sp.]
MDAHGRVTSGRLFYLMGPSGAGKDSLLDACRGARVNHRPLLVATRYITREAGVGGEAHVAMSPEAFLQHQTAGRFALHWRANGRHYGISTDIDYWLARGDTVLVNGSRAHLDQAMARYQELLVPVLVYVDPHQQRQRLLARGREAPDEIERRIERSRQLQAELMDRCATVDNSDSLNRATEQLLGLIRQYQAETVLP